MRDRGVILYGWIVLVSALITIVLGYAIRNTFSVFYPTIVEEFGWGRGSTAVMFSMTILVYGLMAPVAGGLIDRFEPRYVISAGAVLVGGGISLCSLATTEWHFYLLYGVVVAVGLSLVGWTPLTAIVSNWFVHRRGLAFGLLGAGFGGSLVFASVAQLLISSFGWQTAYVIIGLASIAIIVPIAVIVLRHGPRQEGLRPDEWPNAPSGRENPDGPPMNRTPASGWTRGSWTLRRALRTHQYWLLFSISFCLLGLAEQIAIAHQVFFFRDVGYAPMRAANIYSVFGVAFVIGNLCSALSDRLGREAVFIPSCLLCVWAVFLLFLIKDTSRIWMPFSFALIFGLGLGTAAPVFYAAVADLFQGSHFGAIQGTVVLGFSLGGAISPWLAGALHDRTGSYFSTFLILLGSLVASILCMWAAAPRKVRPV